jgi:hypothetical protein
MRLFRLSCSSQVCSVQDGCTLYVHWLLLLLLLLLISRA